MRSTNTNQYNPIPFDEIFKRSMQDPKRKAGLQKLARKRAKTLEEPLRTEYLREFEIYD